MIRKADDIINERIEKARGGAGHMFSKALLQGKEFCDKGRMFNHIVLPPGSSVGVHTHTGDIEAYYIIKGEGLYNDNGNMVNVAEGDVTYCYDGEMHGLENNGNEDLEFIALILFS